MTDIRFIISVSMVSLFCFSCATGSLRMDSDTDSTPDTDNNEDTETGGEDTSTGSSTDEDSEFETDESDTARDTSQDTSGDSETGTSGDSETDTGGAVEGNEIVLTANQPTVLDLGVTYIVDIGDCTQKKAGIGGDGADDTVVVDGTEHTINYHKTVDLSDNPAVVEVVGAAGGTVTVNCY